MFGRAVFILCVVVVKSLMVLGDDCDLKLSRIFRTPKDFSKVNFDHFEILERNNFDSSPEKSETNEESYKPSQAIPKSIANAQIMLRFGGDDIHGRNYLGTTGKISNKPYYAFNPSTRHICHYPEMRHPYYPNYLSETYAHPKHIPVDHSIPAYPPPFHYYYPYAPPPPVPYSLPHFSYQHRHHRELPKVHQFLKEDIAPCPVKPLDGDFSEFKNGGLKNQHHPKILQTKDLSNDKINDNLSDKSDNISTNEKDDSLSSKNNSLPTNSSIEKLEHESNKGKSQKVNMQLLDNDINTNTEKEDLTVIPLSEINIQSSDQQSQEVQSTQSTPDEAGIPNIELWLNKSLVPYRYVKNGGEYQKMLVSYPITEDKTKRPKSNNGMCNCMAQKGYCSCCRRKNNIPVGKRFPADMDSLHVVRKPMERLTHLPVHSPCLSGGHYHNSCGYQNLGNRIPEMYIDELTTSSGYGYYSDPSKEVYFQEPSVIDIVKGRIHAHERPHLVHKTVQEPPVYKIIPKFDIVPKHIPTLDVPELISTNEYRCTCPFTYPQNYYSDRPRFYCPVHGHLGSQYHHPTQALVIDVPDEKRHDSSYEGPFLEYVIDPNGIR